MQRPMKKKKQPRGRMMLVKIFYALSSPRFIAPSNPDQPPPQPSPFSSVHSPSFLSILDPSLAPTPPATSSLPSPLPSQHSHQPPPPPLPPPLPPQPPPPQQQQSDPTPTYSCIARLSAPVWVQLVGSAKNGRPAHPSGTEYAKVTLKTCLSAICISRPELVADASKDYAISALDPYESSLLLQQQQQQQDADSKPSQQSQHQQPGAGLMEGKGMLSWNLAEKREGTTWVCGKVAKRFGWEQAEEGRERKRRKLDEGAKGMEMEMDRDEDDQDDDEDDEEDVDTLEVWLQLVERPSLSQNQFLTSLRSFANPEASQSQSLQPQQTSPLPLPISSPAHSLPPGDPIKRPSLSTNPSTTFNKRSRSFMESQPQHPALGLEDQNPQVLALLTQLAAATSGGGQSQPFDEGGRNLLLPAIRSLAQFYQTNNNGRGGGLPLTNNNLNLNNNTTSNHPSPAMTASPAPTPVASTQIEDRQPVASTSSLQLPSTSSTTLPKKKKSTMNLSSSNQTGGGNSVNSTEKGERFPPIGKSAKGNLNPVAKDSGCFNCKRKKSQVWRIGVGEREEDGKVVVCNACGTFFNKNGYHRSKTDRFAPTSSAPLPSLPPPPSEEPVASTSESIPPPSTTGRPLRSRLTATCEADLLKAKQQQQQKKSNSTSTSNSTTTKTSTESTSRTRTTSTTTSTGVGAGATHYNTRSSPGKFFTASFDNGSVMGLGGGSPRGKRSNVVATSPLRKSGRISSRSAGGSANGNNPFVVSGSAAAAGGGGGGLFDSPSNTTPMANGFDFESMFGGEPASPSPRKRGAKAGGTRLPEYLLTASPGTALSRILDDTSVDLGGFGMMVDHHEGTFEGGDGFPVASGSGTQHQHQQEVEDDPLGFFAESFEGKENDRTALMNLFDGRGGGGHQVEEMDEPSSMLGQPTTDFDSILSSLRRDFNTRLSSAHPTNATSPQRSSPPAAPGTSSPCVQPRNNSSGVKSRTSTSSRHHHTINNDEEPTSSILSSFLVGETPTSDSDPWTPNGAGDNSHIFGQGAEDAQTELFRNLTAGSRTSTSFLSHQQRRLLHHQHNHLLMTSEGAFDDGTGSLPPSSPPPIVGGSEASFLPTPSDFEGFTPNAGGDDNMMGNVELLSQYMSAGDGATVSNQDAVQALLASLGAGNEAGTGRSGEGEGKVELDRSMVNQLLQMISNNQLDVGGGQQSMDRGEETSTSTLTSGGRNKVGVNHGRRDGTEEELKELYTTLFSEATKGYGVENL